MKIKIYIGGAYPNGVINEITFKTLKESLSENGFIITEDYKDADFYICNDYVAQEEDKIRWFSKHQRILLVCEPKIVLPNNFKKSIRDKFGLVISRHFTETGIFLQHPQYWGRRVLDVKIRKNKLVIVNANKISLVKGNNYGLRKMSARKFQFVELYGRDWDMRTGRKIKELVIAVARNFFSKTPINMKSIFHWLLPNPKTLGDVKDKYLLMSQYKFALIIENQNTYISEKLFDAFFAGCIPIYVGPIIEESLIPRDLYFHSVPSLEGISAAFELAGGLSYEIWKSKLISWLNEPDTKKYWEESEVQKLLSTLIFDYIKEVLQ